MTSKIVIHFDLDKGNLEVLKERVVEYIDFKNPEIYALYEKILKSKNAKYQVMRVEGFLSELDT